MPVRKIYIDSRFAISGASTNEFTVELPESFTTGPNTKGQVLDATIPHTWHNVETGVNDKLYYIERTNLLQNIAKIITIPAGNYTRETIATTLLGLLNANKEVSNFGTYSVNTTGTNATQGTITVTLSTGAFAIVPDSDLKQQSFYDLQWRPIMSGPAYDINDPQSCNEMFRVVESTGFVGAWTPIHVDMLHVHTVFLHCSDLVSSYDNMGPQGERGIIRRIGIDVPYNYVQQVQTSGSPYDYFECANRTIKTLKFSIRTAKNKALNFHGTHCSFCIVFFDTDE